MPTCYIAQQNGPCHVKSGGWYVKSEKGGTPRGGSALTGVLVDGYYYLASVWGFSVSVTASGGQGELEWLPTQISFPVFRALTLSRVLPGGGIGEEESNGWAQIFCKGSCDFSDQSAYEKISD